MTRFLAISDDGPWLLWPARPAINGFSPLGWNKMSVHRLSDFKGFKFCHMGYMGIGNDSQALFETEKSLRSILRFAVLAPLAGVSPRLRSPPLHKISLPIPQPVLKWYNQNHQLNWWYAAALKGHITGTPLKRP